MMYDKARLREVVSNHEVFAEWEFAGKHAAPTDIEKVNDLWGKPRKWRFDFAIPALRLAWEIEGGVWTGGRHNSSVGFLKDIDKYNTATALGWSVIRSDNSEQGKADAMNYIRIVAETKDKLKQE